MVTPKYGQRWVALGTSKRLVRVKGVSEGQVSYQEINTGRHRRIPEASFHRRFKPFLEYEAGPAQLPSAEA